MGQAPPINFHPYPKVARWNKDIIITEKLDGTNASIYIPEDGGPILAGSRNRWITPDDDNFGFAAWVHHRREELRAVLGPGRHFGEWFGRGIQRGYGLKGRLFYLFNVSRWKGNQSLFNVPSLGVVPTLYEGPNSEDAVDNSLNQLRVNGSQAVPHYDNPEGIVIFHTGSNTCYKITLDGDGHKGQKEVH